VDVVPDSTAVLVLVISAEEVTPDGKDDEVTSGSREELNVVAPASADEVEIVTLSEDELEAVIASRAVVVNSFSTVELLVT